MYNSYSSKDLLTSENNSTYSHYCQKSLATKVSTPCVITAIHRLTMQSHVSYSSCSCLCLLDRTIHICVSCFRAVQIRFFEYNYLSVSLSTKMAKAIRSSETPWNWVTVQWPGSYRGFPRWVSLGTGLVRVDQRRWVLVLCIRSRSWLQK